MTLEGQVTLHRDTLSTPWGFRLQGGADFKTPLTIQRVFVGSPADGTLSRGDVITAIQNYDASKMIHKQAMDIVKQAGGSLQLAVRRCAPVAKTLTIQTPQNPSQPYRSRPPDTTAPLSPQKPTTRIPEFGMDYRQPKCQQPSQQASHHGLGHMQSGPPESMLDRLNRSLSSTLLWNADDGDEDYVYKGVGDLKRQFAKPAVTAREARKHVKDLLQHYTDIDGRAQTLPRPQPRPSAPSHMKQPSVGAAPVWQRPQPQVTSQRPPAGLVEPGWTPQAVKPAGWRPVEGPGRAPPMVTRPVAAPVPMHHAAPVVPPPPVNRPQRHDVIPHLRPERPAWAGSLKSSGGPKPWEMREAQVIAEGGPSGIPPAAQQPVVHQPRVQSVNYGPGAAAPTYSQHSPSNYGPSDTAQVKHLQYNSPLGLYSQDNVQDALAGQTAGRPGEGTLQVSGGRGHKGFDPDRSDVLRLLQEEESIKRRGYGLRQAPADGAPPAQSARYIEQQGDEMNYQGYVDQSQRSPALARLEANLQNSDDVSQSSPNIAHVSPAALSPAMVAVDEGTSDF